MTFKGSVRVQGDRQTLSVSPWTHHVTFSTVDRDTHDFSKIDRIDEDSFNLHPIMWPTNPSVSLSQNLTMDRGHSYLYTVEEYNACIIKRSWQAFDELSLPSLMDVYLQICAKDVLFAHIWTLATKTWILSVVINRWMGAVWLGFWTPFPYILASVFPHEILSLICNGPLWKHHGSIIWNLVLCRCLIFPTWSLKVKCQVFGWVVCFRYYFMVIGNGS